MAKVICVDSMCLFVIILCVALNNMMELACYLTTSGNMATTTATASIILIRHQTSVKLAYELLMTVMTFQDMDD